MRVHSPGIGALVHIGLAGGGGNHDASERDAADHTSASRAGAGTGDAQEPGDVGLAGGDGKLVPARAGDSIPVREHVT